MADERWQRVKDVLGGALECSPDTRDEFLREECGGDDRLRGEVESLLAVHPEMGEFLAQPARVEAAEATRLAAGARLGSYEVRARLGCGGRGEVYEAFDARLKRTVAIKVVQRVHPRAQARLWREARHASGLSHPNICVVHEIGEAEGLAYIVMERVEGRSLAAAIPEEGLAVEEALGYALQMAGALAHAHENGLVHRDLKTANVMVTRDGHVKVLDFGLARRVDETPAATGESGASAVAATVAVPTGDSASLTAAGAIAGTLSYMAPEVLAGQPADARSDVWAAGVVIHEMLTGARPFESHDAFELSAAIQSRVPPALPSRVPTILSAVVRRCLVKDPAGRYASGRELHAALEKAAAAARRFRVRSLLARPAVAVPLILCVASVAAASAWVWKRSSRARWARETALPEIARMTEQGRIDAAYRLARQAASYVPADPALRRVLQELTVPLTVRTTPPGAEVFAKSYLAEENAWESLGLAPVANKRVHFGYFRFRVSKEGFDTVEGAFAPQLNEVIEFTLDAAGARPPGMVRVSGGPVQARGIPAAKVPDFWLDRYEVTNREFQQFVDGGGYHRREYWKQPFVLDGRSLRWEEAMARFVDATGRPGPSTWRLGRHPDGQADHPVRGVSWHEAAAYAEFAGKSLPTVYHWHRAAGDLIFTDILSVSNFGGEGPAPVGRYQGVGRYGTYDMAGNVKEWCWNATGSRRYILGGAWNEPTYMFVRDQDALSPFNRAPTHGFRCAKYPNAVASALLEAVGTPVRDYTKERPVGDDVFDSYRSIYSYDRGELRAAVESVEEAPHWRKERITFDAAYGNERVAAYLFVPRNARPPYQTVVWFPGVYAAIFKSSADLGVMFYADFLPRTGRALLFPIYKGTYERNVPPGVSGPNAYRDSVIQRSKDLGRSIDYLKTRADIDTSRLAFYGFSWGANEGVILTAIESRLKTAVLLAGGLPSARLPPVVDPLHFAPRVRMPVLMLNGREDYAYPLETSAAPLFRLLDAPPRHKRLVVFESGHVPPPITVTREVGAWLDQHLGPVATIAP